MRAVILDGYGGLQRLRARERLCVSHAESRRIHGETRPAMASHFIEEIPAEHLSEVRTRVQVKFAGAGSKWLMLDMAGLTPA